MASDLISREALLATLNDLEATGGHKYYLKGANDVLHDIMPQILADAQPLTLLRWSDAGIANVESQALSEMARYCAIGGDATHVVMVSATWG